MLEVRDEYNCNIATGAGGESETRLQTQTVITSFINNKWAAVAGIAGWSIQTTLMQWPGRVTAVIAQYYLTELVVKYIMGTWLRSWPC